MHKLLLRAIVTGFGYKLGAELGRYVAEKVGLSKKPEDKKAAEDSGYPTGMTDGLDPDPEDGEGGEGGEADEAEAELSFSDG